LPNPDREELLTGDADGASWMTERKVLRPFKIPPLVLLATVLALAVGELACGTGLYFVTMLVIAMLSIGVTYNLLGGVATFSGIIFTAFALTITVYAVFYLSAMFGVFLFGHLRFRLPRPLEANTQGDRLVLYGICLVAGLTASVIYESYNVVYGSDETVFSQGRSLGLAFAPLLLMAIVVAVDRRVQKTDGRHSFGVAALIPWLAAGFFGFVDTVRTAMLAPSIVYLSTCYLRGYRFRLRHYIAVGALTCVFVAVISPLALYTRGLVEGRALASRIHFAFEALSGLEDRSAVLDQVENETNPREQYFSAPGTYVISRLSLIRADSTIVSAAAYGARYGFKPTWIALEEAVPRMLDKNKVTYTNPQDYIGHFAGMSAEGATNSSPQFSAVGDSFGAFGWAGVVLFPLLVFPLIFILYESMFDISRPWGTVMFGMLFLNFGEMMVHRSVEILLRDPFYIVLLSYFIGGIARFIPKRADSSLRVSSRKAA